MIINWLRRRIEQHNERRWEEEHSRIPPPPPKITVGELKTALTKVAANSLLVESDFSNYYDHARRLARILKVVVFQPLRLARPDDPEYLEGFANRVPDLQSEKRVYVRLENDDDILSMITVDDLLTALKDSFRSWSTRTAARCHINHNEAIRNLS